MYEKILLDMNIIPSLKNLDWKMIDFQSNQFPETISEESFEKKELNEQS